MQSFFRPSCLVAFIAIAQSLRQRRARKNTCEEQWGNKACEGQFGNEVCQSCGEWIEELIGRGLDDASARQRTADKFISQCGACGTKSGDTDLSNTSYELVWSDEFDGTGMVDLNKWRVIHQAWDTNNELQFYTNRTDNVWMSDGTLKIRAVRENYGGRLYTAGKLETLKAWTYGKFHVRARVPGVARGTWAAHWMYPKREIYGDWPKSGEIDIMEHVGMDTGKVHGTVHTQAYHHSIGTQIGGYTTLDIKGWHTYTTEWRKDIMLFACDGVVYQVFRKESNDSDEWPFDHDFFLILNMAVGGDWGGQLGIDEDAFKGEGQIMEVDWARVEQREV